MSSVYYVSVIVAVYNASQSLEASVLSLQNQSLKGIEIIIVNDASTDSSLQIAEALVAKDSRIKILNLPENIGVYKARAAGIHIASAPWIGFLDADDFAKPQMFQTLLESAQTTGAEVVICESDRVNAERKFLTEKVRFRENKVIEDKIFTRFCNIEFGSGALWNKLYKAELIKKWGTIEHAWRQDTNEDVLINIGVFHEATKIFLLKNPLHEYSLNLSSVTSTIDRESAFTHLIKSYCLALKVYAFFDKESLSDLTELYRHQLEYSDYRLVQSLKSEIHIQDLVLTLKEAMELNPSGTLSLISRRPMTSQEYRIGGFKVPKIFKKIKKNICRSVNIG